ncbi:hypothetical protein T492DRAFT_861302, partial [Pavlovales sp. CCMP2436]
DAAFFVPTSVDIRTDLLPLLRKLHANRTRTRAMQKAALRIYGEWFSGENPARAAVLEVIPLVESLMASGLSAIGSGSSGSDVGLLELGRTHDRHAPGHALGDLIGGSAVTKTRIASGADGFWAALACTGAAVAPSFA